MRNILLFTFIILSFTNIAQDFKTHFSKGSLRIDYIHSATHDKEIFSLNEYYHEPYWGGSELNLIDTFNYGYYKF